VPEKVSRVASPAGSASRVPIVDTNLLEVAFTVITRPGSQRTTAKRAAQQPLTQPESGAGIEPARRAPAHRCRPALWRVVLKVTDEPEHTPHRPADHNAVFETGHRGELPAIRRAVTMAA
jgi:hypothetical protein